MKKIGNFNKFGIEYSFLENPYNEQGLFGKSWGYLKFFIDGKDICEYLEEGIPKIYTWNLYFIVEWLCENLEFILGYDPFPLPVKGESTIELINVANGFEIEEEKEEYLWHNAMSSWIFRHTWFSSRGGSTLTSAYFYRKGNDIEVSWDNEFWSADKVEFIHLSGFSRIKKEEFREVILEFLYDILNNFETTTEAEGMQIKNFIKRIDLLN